MRVEEVGVQVTIGGMTVNPGDLIHADQHGVLLVPHEVAADLPAAADRVVAREQILIKWVRSDDFSAEKLAERRRVKH
jgi:regulator of RNase E activity RraA